VIPARLSIAMFEDIAVTTNLSLIFAITEYLTVIFEAIWMFAPIYVWPNNTISEI
jgi:hypothetical protein